MVSGRIRPHKLERICFPVRRDELIDIPIHHPFRYHCELVFIRRNAHQRQHIWMAKGVPSHNLLAELLHGPALAGQRTILAKLCKLTLVILPMSLVE